MTKAQAFGLLSLLLLNGCATAAAMEGSVKNRAGFDLNCPKEQLAVTELGTKTYGVQGCGRRATYLLQGECSFEHNCQAIMNSDERPER